MSESDLADLLLANVNHFFHMEDQDSRCFEDRKER